MGATTAPKAKAETDKTEAAKSDYVVALGVLVVTEGKSTREAGVGEKFVPADDEERDSLLKAGRIMLASDYVGTAVQTADFGALRDELAAANARADAEKDRADRLQAELDKLKAPAQT